MEPKSRLALSPVGLLPSWKGLKRTREGGPAAIFLTRMVPHTFGRDRARTQAIAARIVARDDLT